MQTKGRSRLLEPMESRSRISGAATVMARPGGLFKVYGGQYEETVRVVRVKVST